MKFDYWLHLSNFDVVDKIFNQQSHILGIVSYKMDQRFSANGFWKNVNENWHTEGTHKKHTGELYK